MNKELRMQVYNKYDGHCPFCDNYFTVVQDSREIENGTIRKRRRKCTKYGKTFSTHEMRVEHVDKRVTKTI